MCSCLTSWSSTAGHAAPLSRGPEETEAEGNGKLGLRRSLSCLHDDGVSSSDGCVSQHVEGQNLHRVCRLFVAFPSAPCGLDLLVERGEGGEDGRGGSVLSLNRHLFIRTLTLNPRGEFVNC